MEKKENTLVMAPVKTVYLKNEVSEKVMYLDLPYHFDTYSLESDVQNGGVQFKEIEKLTHKKRISRVVALSADSVEMGLMAVTYLAMHLLVRRQDAGQVIYADDLPFGAEPVFGEKLPFGAESVFGEKLPFDAEPVFSEKMPFDRMYDIGEASEWEESEMRIPVISYYEISKYLENGRTSAESGGYLMAQARNKITHPPYWKSCRREPVCVVIHRESADSACLDAINLFIKNRNVFVLFLEEEHQDYEMLDEIPFSCIDRPHFNALRNNFILSYAADAVEVSFGKNDSLLYYQNVFRQNIRQRGIKVKKGFSYERVVNLACSINKFCVCEMLDKIINYTVKDMDESEEIVFRNSTFDFVDHFMRETSGRETEKGKALMEANLVGLGEIKQQVYDVVNVMKYNQMRRRMNITGSHYHNVHVMLGAPGTAKTTVAKYMGMMMFDEKLLPDNRFICINGAELKGKYVGHSAPKTKALFENYDVIIIDEAYSIVESDGKTDSFGNEAIAQLIIELEKYSTDKLIIFAGYGGKKLEEKDNRMHAFLEANPGIKSRITTTFYFDSYSADEMAQIFARIAKISNYKLKAGTEQVVKDFFEKRVHDKDFGNGREARALLENAAVFAARRIMAQNKESYTRRELTTLTLEDVKAAVEKMDQGFGIRRKDAKQIGFTR